MIEKIKELLDLNIKKYSHILTLSFQGKNNEHQLRHIILRSKNEIPTTSEWNKFTEENSLMNDNFSWVITSVLTLKNQ